MTRSLAVSVGLLLIAAATVDAQTKPVTGKVTAVSAESLTIMNGSQSMTFGVDAKTKVLGKGLGTLANEKKNRNEPFVITDGVANDDTVKVNYVDAGGGKLQATEVHVIQKGLKSQAEKK